MNRKAVVYTRLSPKPKGGGDQSDSHLVQREACARYAKQSSLEVLKEFEDDAVSGTSEFLRREGVSTMLSRMQSSITTDVIVQRLDRAFRDTADGLKTLEFFESKKIRLHLADQGGCAINAGTATGKLITTVLLAQTAFERDIIAERTSGAMKFKQSSGTRMTPAAKCPYGYMQDPEDPSRIIECPREQLAISKILEWHAKGYRAGDIMKCIRDYAEPRGKKWHRSTIKKIIERHA